MTPERLDSMLMAAALNGVWVLSFEVSEVAVVQNAAEDIGCW
jgi:hypothetical protein